MSESRKVVDPARCHLKAADRLILIVEHEAGCHCCQHAARSEEAILEATEIVLSDWVRRAEWWRTQAYLWAVVTACSVALSVVLYVTRGS